jgi:hypothetical protein
MPSRAVPRNQAPGRAPRTGGVALNFMSLLPRLLEAYMLGRRRRSGWGAPAPRYGYGRSRRRSRVGFFGPFPTYSTRTRRGSRVTVTGCCLPIPLTLSAGFVLGLRALLRR